MADGHGSMPPDEPPTTLYVGQHESQRSGPVTSKLLGQAQLFGYDLLTAPLTTSHFQSRVLATLEDHVHDLQNATSPHHLPLPTISPLLPADTHLTPEDSNSALIGIVSPWIDLGSPDPLVLHISRQVFSLELAYAAFCGISNVLIHGPIQDSNVLQFSRAILEGLSLGPYLQLQILLPTTGELELEGADGVHLAELARKQYASPVADEDGEDEDEPHRFESWVDWNTIRSVCGYSSKLTVGMCSPFSTNFSFVSTPILFLSAEHQKTQIQVCHRPYRWRKPELTMLY